MNDLTVIAISLSVILLCWAVVRINQKIERSLRNPSSINEIDSGTDPGE